MGFPRIANARCLSNCCFRELASSVSVSRMKLLHIFWLNGFLSSSVENSVMKTVHFSNPSKFSFAYEEKDELVAFCPIVECDVILLFDIQEDYIRNCCCFLNHSTCTFRCRGITAEEKYTTFVNSQWQNMNKENDINGRAQLKKPIRKVAFEWQSDPK